MFEANMIENIQEMQKEPEWVNSWRSLVSVEFKEFLDSISTSKKIVEQDIDDDYEHSSHRLMK